MVELFYSPTPNGRKVSIMLEETKIKYKITPINLGKKEQFKPEFLKINPYGKIPAIIDHEKDLVLIESGAILIYLARKSNQFLPKENEIRIFEWLMFQISNVGPTLGQLHHFSHFNPGKSLYSEERFYKGALKVYAALNNQLKKNIIKKTNMIPDFIDIGGGFPTIYPDLRPQSLNTYIFEIKKALANLKLEKQPKLMCEPGRALVAESGSTIVRVVLRKKQKKNLK